ncbi:hypothetical protein PUNSTDRAFT_95882 [Punctularia strigosozonata HHB-11173 SS5]|uniref:uncharacterized protein n=1 Tax=Punctularia strigosozonata (strain HHB-11173) TaxID=741275 RepID=UPI0004416808|nr:uncharacterized protein PUNSTDRAFT_95882 [Punctularia strigosozonata HHB-11173 SS5]EIN14209.1 hypothetical protein PUNSTDRAFT_95882 [Punctularia strigosozonata HHB-11173 SS5]
MPAITQGYEVLLDFTNDTRDSATVQLQRDYGHQAGTAVLLRPGETVTLVLDAGAVYRYCLKTRTRVANVTARTWRDVHCDVSKLFPPAASQSSRMLPESPVNGLTIDRLWRDVRFCMWYDA